MNRRSFLKSVAAGSAAIVAAPWVVRAESLMPIVARRALPLAYGRIRAAGLVAMMGDMIETATRLPGGITHYEYSVDEVGLVTPEGTIQRVWADGRPFPAERFAVVNGVAVLRDLPLAEFGNRLPDFEFEILAPK